MLKSNYKSNQVTWPRNLGPKSILFEFMDQKITFCPSVLLSSNKISRKSLRTSKCRNSREERCHLVYYASNFGLVEFTRHPNINLSEPSFMSKQRNWTKWTTTLLVLLKRKITHSWRWKPIIVEARGRNLSLKFQRLAKIRDGFYAKRP